MLDFGMKIKKEQEESNVYTSHYAPDAERKLGGIEVLARVTSSLSSSS